MHENGRGTRLSVINGNFACAGRVWLVPGKRYKVYDAIPYTKIVVVNKGSPPLGKTAKKQSISSACAIDNGGDCEWIARVAAG
jgi:hypothetical protein